MRLFIAAVGRLKDGPERVLLTRYLERATALGRSIGLGPLSVIEIRESRATSSEKRRSDEAQSLLAKLPEKVPFVALDEHAKPTTSRAFADYLRKERDEGLQGLAFVIGGADGQGNKVLKAARMTLSLGPMTLPHGLVRIILAEQIYRAETIIAGHPYHRD